ncbi:MAG: hypothetical protein EPO16_00145 [Dehalococcoidia bacterium]|nr:MAG: hypothetical protein EPO16_00145 [Dehalococcoidia bacterium]
MALTIGAVVAGLFGLGLTLAPEPMVGGFMNAFPTEAEVLSRDLGVTLLSLGVLNWMTRDATGPALRGVLVGNLLIQVLEIVVNGIEIAADKLPTAAAGGLVVHVVLGGIFASALMRRERV